MRFLISKYCDEMKENYSFAIMSWRFHYPILKKTEKKCSYCVSEKPSLYALKLFPFWNRVVNWNIAMHQKNLAVSWQACFRTVIAFEFGILCRPHQWKWFLKTHTWLMVKDKDYHYLLAIKILIKWMTRHIQWTRDVGISMKLINLLS